MGETNNLLIELIKLFAIAGGFGYLNYFILHTEGVINRNKSKEDRLFFLLFFSIINLFIYEVIASFLSDLVVKYLPLFSGFSTSITILISLIIIFISLKIFRWLIPLVYEYINAERKKNKLSMTNNLGLVDGLLDHDKYQEAYIFDLHSDKLLASGFVSAADSFKDNFNLILKPFNPGWAKDQHTDYESVKEAQEKNDIESLQYIDLERKIKIVIFYYQLNVPE